ncbi:YcaO-like family protein [Nonomuraea sp. NPDC049504]|uniref:YcaO-like family protein n=1 Tax=Nonomuraea sp. NPDC049504 TaxID=3154729 RepID=UPI003447130B
MRVRWREDAYAAADGDGVHILTHRGLARIDGASIAGWVDRLAPFLDGERTVGELTAGLPPARGDAVRKVIDLLLECDAVQMVAEEPPRTPGGDFLGCFRTPAVATFDDYRRLRVALVGAEPMLESLARAARVSGLENVTRIDISAPRGTPPPEGIGPPEGTELVLYAGDGPSALPLNRMCARRRIPLALLVHTGDATWLVPPGGPDWEDAWRRLGSPTGHVAAAPSGAAARLVHAAFRVMTGVMPDTERDHLVRIGPDGYTSTRHACLPHPARATAAGGSPQSFHRRLRDLRAGRPVDDATFLRDIAACYDEHLGLFTLAEAAGPQTPLNVCRAVLKGTPDMDVLGVGFGYDAATGDAARKALAAYALREATEQGGHLWAYEIDDPDAVRSLRVPGAFGTTDAGLAAGSHWEQAVGEGLADQCLRLTLAELRSRSEPCPRVDVATADLPAEGRRCRDVLARLDQLPDVYDVTGPLGVPAVVCCAGTVTVGYFAALNPAKALQKGLKAVLLHLQSPQRTPVEPFPDQLRGARCRPMLPGLGASQVASRLRARGLVALTAPLDRDPAIAELMPYLAKVVIEDA